MTDTAPAPAAFYRPREVAQMLRCSEWWVKEQARRRRIPYCWIGGSYLFTQEHVAAIVRLFEVLPTEACTPVPPAGRARHSGTNGSSGAAVLVARVPRRARAARTDKAA